MEKIFSDLYNIILEKKLNGEEGSYTKYLLSSGTDKILKKFGEETIEVIIASKGESKEHQILEMSDMLYHLLVLMVDKEIEVKDIQNELLNRKSKINNFKGERKKIENL